MEGLSVKLPPEVRRRLAEEARRRNVTQSAIVRELIERALAEEHGREPAPSCAALARVGADPGLVIDLVRRGMLSVVPVLDGDADAVARGTIRPARRHRHGLTCRSVPSQLVSGHRIEA